MGDDSKIDDTVVCVVKMAIDSNYNVLDDVEVEVVGNLLSRMSY